MKRSFFLLTLLVGLNSFSNAQSVGLSFSYFVPRNGYFSTPISPFSIRGVGYNFTKHFGVQTGATLYRMSGLNLIDLPIESKDPMLGPNFTIFIPAEFVYQLKGRRTQLDIKAGGFFFYGFDQKLNTGNIDRAIRSHMQLDVVNSDLSFKNNPGLGKHFGAEFTYYVTSQFGISLETNYLMGTAKIPLTGSYVGGTMAGGLNPPVNVNSDFKNAKVDFTGFEFSVGVILTGGSGPQRPKARRRR